MFTETLTFYELAERLPDDSTTVIVAIDPNTSHSEPVWLGYLDGDQWRDVAGEPITVVRWAEMPASVIDTADHVRHGPTGEEWLVARVNGKHLHPCGWPASRADLSDCTLTRKATPAARMKLLQELATGQSDHAEWARSRLANGPTPK